MCGTGRFARPENIRTLCLGAVTGFNTLPDATDWKAAVYPHLEHMLLTFSSFGTWRFSKLYVSSSVILF
jgi:hypothetical protein